MTMELDQATREAAVAVLHEAQVLAGDYDAEVAEALRLAAEQPLDPRELEALFTKIVIRLKAGRDADDETRRRVADEVRGMVADLVAEHERSAASRRRYHLPLQSRYGLEVRPVRPAPTFLGQQIELQEGFVQVPDLTLWAENHRLDLHVAEFKQMHQGRSPRPEEILRILWGSEPGVGDDDEEFKIRDLADSIAVNGVRVPPVIDWWGTPYDGNRRIAACLLILRSDEYTDDEREKASWVRVWQAPEDATREQIDRIVVSLNFEKDLKQRWPEYVRAKQVFDDYGERCEMARRGITIFDEKRIKRDVAKKFGIRTDEVTRYVKMVDWALEFEEYHEANGRPPAEVAHRTNKYFQYFYELDSGRGDDKLATKLREDDGFKGLVFDLLYDGKFRNWTQIRDLRRVYQDDEARDLLAKAATTEHRETARQQVRESVEAARRHDIALKQIGVQDRVENFTKWLETEATQKTWREHVSIDLLRRFLTAVRAAEGTVATVLADREGS